MRHGKLWGLLAAVLALIILATAAAPVYASVQKLEQERGTVQRELQQERRNLKEQHNRRTELEGELEQLDQRLGKLQSELAEVNNEITTTETEVAQTQEALAETETELAGKEELFKRRLRTIYEQGSQSYVDILFGASSFSDFLTRFNNLKIIAASDQDLIEEVRAERDRIEEMKKELEQKKSSLDRMRRKLLNNETAVEQTIASRKSVRGELQQEIAQVEQAIKELDQAEQDLEWQIRALSSQGTGESTEEGDGGGKLRFPVEPPYAISSPFGWRIHPIYKDWRLHTGIDIATNGQPNYILAAGAGSVIIVGYSEVFGYHITIDHGNGLTTVYKHLRKGSITVGVGRQVTRGQRIARAGSTGRDTTGVHLHFEVRINGVPKNPMKYF